MLLALALLAGAGTACRSAAVDAGRPSSDGALAAAGGADYRQVVATLEPFIAHELADKQIPAIAIALVDDQRIVWSRGFGFEHPKNSTRATAQTVFRVGSVSKLFTDIGIMQLVERGQLDLDAPVSRYLPDFAPRNPYAEPVTLRELMSHRSGLVREPPAGNYFDTSGTSLAATVASLDSTALVYRPGTHTKYSNAAIATVGYVLQQTQRVPFPEYLRQSVLMPMGLTHSAFTPEPELTPHLAAASMWTYFGRIFPAPTFQLGMSPAGSMYTTVPDLGRFLSVLFADGRGANGQPVIRPETLHQMWTPQFAPPGETTGYGLGFALSELEGHRRFGHGGAIYGFSTELEGLPDDKLGVVVVATMDGANAVTHRIADVALRLMLAARQHRPLRAPEMPAPVPPPLARRLEGRYGSGERAIDLTDASGTLYAMPARGGVRVTVRALGDTLIADGRLAYGARMLPLADAIIVGPDTLQRVAVPKPAPVRAAWRGLIGEYGWEHNIFYVLEKDGQLNALIEWFYQYPLTEVAPDVYTFPHWGLYDGQELVFTRDSTGRATQVMAASVRFPRRNVGPEDGSQFRITPVQPVAELRAEALAARPPVERGVFRPSDLVEIVSLDSTIKLDIRYASSNNFVGTPFYSEARAFLQRPAAEAVVRAHRALRAQGYGLLIHDAYRPWYVTRMFWDATPPDKHMFVADPSQGSRHNRGAAVDLTLYDLPTGQEIRMTGGYDEFSDRSYPFYPGGTALERWQRDLLRHTMEAQGFTVYDAEWWHFDYKDWGQYPIGNVTFDQIAPARSRR